MRMRRALLTLALALGLVPMAAAPSVAFTGIDQRYEVTDQIASGTTPVGQSFTAGMDGKLTAVSIHAGASMAGQELQIRTAVAGLPTGTVLASTTITTSATGWIKIPVDPVTVAAGSRYALIIVPHGASNQYFGGGSGAGYEPGTVFFGDGTDWTPFSNDLAFRTYVRTATDPDFSWVSTPTKPSAGATATYRFSLGGSFGLDVIRGGSPTTTRVSCSTGEPIKGTTFRTRPFGGAISYDPSTETYAITWKVRPQWGKGALACRTFEVFVRGEREPHVVVVKVRQPAN